MWILRGSRDEVYYLLPGKEHVVSRKGGDLLLADDQSISRKHAVFTVEHNSENWNEPERPPVVNIIETGSKYGTVINPDDNSSSMAHNSKQQLFDGDKIKFGVQWNVWRLVYEPLIVVMSTLSAKQKKEVKEIVGTLGGHVITNWTPDCTHVTMCNITLTVKAICALAYGKPIVMPSFWENYMTTIQMKKPLPSYEDFIPPLTETIINKNEVSFHINTKRRTLFKGNTFLFFSTAQYNEHECLVTAAGGTARVLDKQLLEKEELIKPDIIIMQHSFDSSSQNSPVPESFIELISYMKSNKKRVIPIHEIGLAILHCSIEKYCNPDFNFASLMLKSNKSVISDLASQKVLASDTQDDQLRNRNVSKVKITIPESGSVPKQQVGKPKTDEYEPTLSLVEDYLVKKKEAEESTSRARKDCLLSFGRMNQDSQKRPRKVDEFDACSLKRYCISENKNLDMLIKPKSNSEAVDLFSFSSDKSQMDDKHEEDIFAFASEGSRKEREESDEDMFAFTKSDDRKAEMEHSLPSCSTDNKTERLDDQNDMFAFSKSDALHALPVDITQSVKQKRKISDVNESLIFGNPTKKLSLLDVSVTSHLNNSMSSNDTSPDFLSVNRKEETIKLEPGCSVLHTTSNSSVVTIKALVISSVPVINTKTKDKSMPENGNLTNFKKFKKIQGLIKRIVPCIIGGQDLEAYASDLSSITKTFIENHSDEEEEVEDNWAFVTVSQAKKKVQRKKY